MIILLSFLIFPKISLGKVFYYSVDAEVFQNLSTKFNLILTFEGRRKDFEMTLPFRTYNFNYETNFPAECKMEVEEISVLKCNFSDGFSKGTLNLEFWSDDVVKKFRGKYVFDADLSVFENVSSLSIFVKLPERYWLSEGESVFPKPDQILSDGKRIILKFSRTDVTAQEPIKIRIYFEGFSSQGINARYLIVLIILVFGIMVSIFVTYLKKIRSRGVRLIEILDPDERKVINIIKKNGGKVNQKVIVRETDFSKAKVSRLVKNLERRKIVKIERLGRANIIHLKRNIE